MTFEQVISHEFFMAFYGIIAWYVILWSMAKNKGENGFKTREWLRKYYDDMLVTVIVAFGFVSWDDEVILMWNSYVEKDIELARWMYLLPGVMTDMIYKIIGKLRL